MIGKIISIGDELTSGRITNTSSSFAARHLFAAGHDIYAIHTIGDSIELIGQALQQAIRQVDFVIVTGGLGSTTDDLTNKAVAKALNRPPTLYRDILEKIHASLGIGGSEDTFEKMAWLPEGAEVLNEQSMMAGYMLIHDNKPVFFLPGVPYQMKELLKQQVLPKLDNWSYGNRNQIRQRLYKTFGLPEAVINKRLRNLEKEPKISIGYYPVDGEVHINLTTRNNSEHGDGELFKLADMAIKKALADVIYGTDQETMANAVGTLLKKNNLSMGVAESCTGGMIGEKITRTAGCSAWFSGGVIVYSNQLKETMLGIDRELLDNYGGVSEQVAIAMADRLAHITGTDLTVSVTGIAGPEGGSREKPVGTVYIGLSYNDKVTAKLHNFHGNREAIRKMTTCTALDTARRVLLG
jgi:nicotinamide-nucleotide amidase